MRAGRSKGKGEVREALCCSLVIIPREDVKMKIWLNTSPISYTKYNDCTNPSISSASIAWPLADDGISPIRTHKLEHAALLYIQLCGEEQWLVCNPVGSGYIAVFDAPALSLLSLFETPMTISHAVEMTTDWPRETIESVIKLFYRLGFLRDTSGLSAYCDREESQTLTAWLHVTNNCNLHCDYCYLDKTKEDMAADVGRKAIDAIFRSALKHRFKTVRLKYAGGEASLHMTSVMELHDYAVQLAQEYGIALEACILSNGVILSQHTIDCLKARHIAVTISLDGLGNYHDSQRPFVNGKGSSQYVLRTIDRLLANEIVPLLSR
jgi:uncharacterized protein